jgi:hypothetical protein
MDLRAARGWVHVTNSVRKLLCKAMPRLELPASEPKLRDSTEKSCEILENAQSIANFHKTATNVESRILLAFRLADSALNNFPKRKDFFSHVEAY